MKLILLLENLLIKLLFLAEPTAVTVLRVDDTSLSVNWNVPAEYDSDLSGYR